MRYITSTQGIMGGDPVIVGTRIPITVILSLLKQGYTVKEIHEMYSWVSLRTLKSAIDEIGDIIVSTLHA